MIRLNYGEGSLIGEHNQNVGRPPANPPFTGGLKHKKSGCHFGQPLFFTLYFF